MPRQSRTRCCGKLASQLLPTYSALRHKPTREQQSRKPCVSTASALRDACCAWDVTFVPGCARSLSSRSRFGSSASDLFRAKANRPRACTAQNGLASPRVTLRFKGLRYAFYGHLRASPTRTTSRLAESCDVVRMTTSHRTSPVSGRSGVGLVGQWYCRRWYTYSVGRLGTTCDVCPPWPKEETSCKHLAMPAHSGNSANNPTGKNGDALVDQGCTLRRHPSN